MRPPTFRLLVLVGILVAALALSPPLAAQKGGGSHAGSSHASGSSGTKSSGTVHVRGYTRKDGTHVDGYDRKAPNSKGEGDMEPSLADVARSTAAGQKAEAAANGTQHAQGTPSLTVV